MISAPSHSVRVTQRGMILAPVLSILVTGGSAQAQEVSERELVRGFLASSPQRALAAAARARQQAVGTIAPYLPKPGLLLRREQSFGAATEFSTTVAGVSLSLEIGGRYGLRKQAAALDAEAVALERKAQVVQSLCGLRRRIRAAYAQQEIVALLSRTQRRLERMPSNLRRLVSAGERAKFDLQRMLLLVNSHRKTLALHRAELAALLTEISTLTGTSLSGVRLEPDASSNPKASEPPSVSALRAQAKAEGRRLREAKRRWVPNLDLYGGYRLDQPADGNLGHGYELGLTLNLPITGEAKTVQAATKARRQVLLAEIGARQALRSARLGRLRTRARELRRVVAKDTADPQKLVKAATQRYLSGEGVLSELVDTLHAVTEAALQRLRTLSEIRIIALEAACLQESSAWVSSESPAGGTKP